MRGREEMSSGNWPSRAKATTASLSCRDSVMVAMARGVRLGRKMAGCIHGRGLGSRVDVIGFRGRIMVMPWNIQGIMADS